MPQHSDIVVASALPLPDVGAALTTCLITGYGRDVVVGQMCGEGW